MFRNENCRIAEAEEFLNNLFPVDIAIINKVYEALVKSKLYDDEKSRWSDFPAEEVVEEDTEEDMDDDMDDEDEDGKKAFYKPFVDVAELIREAAPDGATQLHCGWVDRHTEIPETHDRASALIRPDILSLLSMNDNTKLDDSIDACEDQAEQLKVISAWWLRVNVVVEIKMKDKNIKDNTDTLEHIWQLLKYMRWMLGEQLDRCFVPGIIFTKTELAVWICDRSGILGTQSTFNIHTEPKKFIQVILGCSILPPQKLGWDPTMRLHRQPISSPPEFIHSYDRRVTLEDYGKSLCGICWAIEMPSKDDPERRDLYITIQALDMPEAEFMSGRAAIAWVVMKAEDLDKESPRKIFVLKQTWRPRSGVHEGKIYPQNMDDDNHVGRIHSYEDVSHDGDVVDTYYYIRRGIKYRSPQTIFDLNRNGKREAARLEELERREPYLVIDYPLSNVFENTRSPIWRIQARLLIEDYGWSLRDFRDLNELLTVLDHTVTAHKSLYFSGTLHRDISIASLIICPDNSGSVEGRLIDLDYAKQTDVAIASLLGQDEDTSAVSPVILKFSQYSLSTSLGQEVPDNIARVYSKISLPITDYVDALLDYNPKLKGLVPISGKDMGFYDPDTRLPDFSTRIERDSYRTATVPFASTEVLSGTQIFPWPDAALKMTGNWTYPAHRPLGAIHDLEVFFWVLTYLCLTQQGPGGRRRDELMPKWRKNLKFKHFIHVYSCFFENEDIHNLARNKSRLFVSDHYEEHVLEHIHPYFSPLRGLLLKWWKILRLAYQSPTFEAVHDAFLGALGETMSELKRQPAASDEDPQAKEAASAVDEFRKADLASLRRFPHDLGKECDNEATLSLDPLRVRRVILEGSTYHHHEEPRSPTPEPPPAKKQKILKTPVDDK